jgi:hypothetical protein
MEKAEIEGSDNILYIEKEQIRTNDKWEIELSNNDCVVLQNSGSVPTKILFFNIVTNSKNFWEFKSVASGEFTVLNLNYHPGGMWLDYENSYAEDYYVDESLKIHSNGKKPIYEVEKYDKYLFEQFSNEYDLHIDWALDDYPDVTYSAASDYENRTVNIILYGSNSNDESDLRKIIEDCLNEKFQNLNEVMHDTKINITFADSDITNDSEAE